jgi:hypothetical protein
MPNKPKPQPQTMTIFEGGIEKVIEIPQEADDA